MKRFLLTALLLCLPTKVEAQLVYNPSAFLFEHDEATGWALTVSYRIEAWEVGSNPETESPIDTCTVPKSSVIIHDQGPPIVYKIDASLCSALPSGKSYQYRIIALGETTVSPPSEFTPQTARFSYCATASGAIMPMVVAMAELGEVNVGSYVKVTLDISSPESVHSIAIDFLSDGAPAWYFFSPVDQRGVKQYTIGPMPRVGRFLTVIDAVDERGCKVQVADTYVTIR